MLTKVLLIVVVVVVVVVYVIPMAGGYAILGPEVMNHYLATGNFR